MIVDKNNREILAGDTLFNPYDENKTYEVLTDGTSLFLGDFDSPLERYSPSEWWSIINR